MPLSLVFIISAAFVIATASALWIVPLVRSLSRRSGIVDRPDKERKLHGNETALCGGLAVFLATLLGFGSVTILAAGQTIPYWTDLPMQWLVLLGAAFAMMMVGLVDDAITLRGRQKLLAQIVILSCVIGSGTIIDSISIFGYTFNLGMFAYPLTLVWLLGSGR